MLSSCNEDITSLVVYRVTYCHSAHYWFMMFKSEPWKLCNRLKCSSRSPSLDPNMKSRLVDMDDSTTNDNGISGASSPFSETSSESKQNGRAVFPCSCSATGVHQALLHSESRRQLLLEKLKGTQDTIRVCTKFVLYTNMSLLLSIRNWIWMGSLADYASRLNVVQLDGQNWRTFEIKRCVLFKLPPWRANSSHDEPTRLWLRLPLKQCLLELQEKCFEI